jgi:hypothetical protein
MQVMVVVLPRHFAGPDPSSYEPMSVLPRVKNYDRRCERRLAASIHIRAFGTSMLIPRFCAVLRRRLWHGKNGNTRELGRSVLV